MSNWYKSITSFSLNDNFTVNQQELLEKLKEKKIIPCDQHALKTSGWDNVIPEEEGSLCYKIKDKFLLKMKIEEKLIPNAIVKLELEKEVIKREKETGEKVSSSSKKDIKDAIIAKMKKQAFVKPSFIEGYIDPKNKKIIVGSNSSKKADDFISLLRDTLGSLDVEPIFPEYDLSSILTEFILDPNKHDKFSLSHECKLKDISDQSSISAKDEDLTSDEIKEHILSGKSVESISIIWQHRIRFKINNKFNISSIKPLEIIKEQMNDDLGESADDKIAVFEADKILMIEDLNELINDLISIND